MPLEISWAITVVWIAGDITCRIMMFFRTFGLYLSSFILVCISLDRLVNFSKMSNKCVLTSIVLMLFSKQTVFPQIFSQNFPSKQSLSYANYFFLSFIINFSSHIFMLQLTFVIKSINIIFRSHNNLKKLKTPENPLAKRSFILMEIV